MCWRALKKIIIIIITIIIIIIIIIIFIIIVIIIIRFPGGCEAAFHAVRRFMDSMPDDYVIAKLGFSNAFNCFHRDFMLERVAEVCAKIYKFCHLAYSQHSTQQFGDFSISSQSGSQQGDPLVGLLFCLAIHPTLLSLFSSLSVGFMNDLTIGGARSTVASDVDQIRSEGVQIGLHLNVAKCEVITKVHHQFDFEFQGFVNTHLDDACLFGAPLGSGRALDNTLTLRCSDLHIDIGLLKSLPSHDALTLLVSLNDIPATKEPAGLV